MVKVTSASKQWMFGVMIVLRLLCGLESCFYRSFTYDLLTITKTSNTKTINCKVIILVLLVVTYAINKSPGLHWPMMLSCSTRVRLAEASSAFQETGGE